MWTSYLLLVLLVLVFLLLLLLLPLLLLLLSLCANKRDDISPLPFVRLVYE